MLCYVCDSPAEAVVFLRQCDGHLCTTHMEEMSQNLDDGLGDLYREAGIQRGEDFLPIETDPVEICDQCRHRERHEVTARFAEMAVVDEPVCLIHAAGYGWRPPQPS